MTATDPPAAVDRRRVPSPARRHAPRWVAVPPRRAARAEVAESAYAHHWVAVAPKLRAVVTDVSSLEPPAPLPADVEVLPPAVTGPNARERVRFARLLRLPSATRALRLVRTDAAGGRRWSVDVLVRVPSHTAPSARRTA